MTIMSNPIPTKNRKGIEALTGIKSSLGQMRAIIALMYLFYRVNGRKAHILYCKKASDSELTIDDSLLAQIESFLGTSDIKTIIISNPLFDKQFEPLYVGITLLYRLGRITMPGQSSTTIERTGGKRFPKEIFFSNNMVYLDLILQGFPEDILKKSLIEWLKNDKATNADFESRITSFLSLTTIYTQFKIRPEEDKEVYFQTEGLYSAIEAGHSDLKLTDVHEFVGPTRIYNNVLKEGLDPWLNLKKDGSIVFSDIDNPSPKTISEIISTSLEISCVKQDESTNNDISSDGHICDSTSQIIYYGCPGTGKSHKVKKDTEGLEGEKAVYFDDDGNKIQTPDKKEDRVGKPSNIFRTTFHPDYDYAAFVGSYKPVMKAVLNEDGTETGKEELSYDFVPQVFTNAYIRAYRSLADGTLSEEEKQVYLIIEEINRGNCAQIFGDLFQLLDRKDGRSEYAIIPEAELGKYLKGLKYEGLKGDKLELPANLHILATMNTSDQSLFPMDSAFKRRWEMEYIPINLDDKTSDAKDYAFKVKNVEYSWIEFLKKVNPLIRKATDSEDKQMGEFFIKVRNKEKCLSEEEFKNKVMFYLWNDVCKDLYSASRISPDYFLRDDAAEDNRKAVFTFAELYGDGRINTVDSTEENAGDVTYTSPEDLLEGFIAKKLGLKPKAAE